MILNAKVSQRNINLNNGAKYLKNRIIMMHFETRNDTTETRAKLSYRGFIPQSTFVVINFVFIKIIYLVSFVASIMESYSQTRIFPQYVLRYPGSSLVSAVDGINFFISVMSGRKIKFLSKMFH